MSDAQLTRRYELLELIGRGASADVFRARDLNDGRLVALKRLRDQGTGATARFVREAEIMARLEHPMALPLHDFGRDAQARPFLVTELLEGESLAAVLERGALAPLLVVRLIRQIGDVLAIAHGKGVVHRDIKPHNIWIQARFDDGRGPNLVARLLDWGVAYAPQGRELGAATLPAGSPRYMAPEQAAGRPIDGRADLYGLGVVAYECLAGRAPFREGTALSDLVRHLKQRPQPLAHMVPELDRNLAHLIDRLLAHDPGHRPQSAHALDRRLAEIEARLAQEWRAPLPPPSPAQRLAAVLCMF